MDEVESLGAGNGIAAAGSEFDETLDETRRGVVPIGRGPRQDFARRIFDVVERVQRVVPGDRMRVVSEHGATLLMPSQPRVAPGVPAQIEGLDPDFPLNFKQNANISRIARRNLALT